MTAPLPREVLICTIAQLLDGLGHVAVGASSPMPAAGAMLRRALDEAAHRLPVRLSILG
jgi:glutaconate CoA-transferase subunit B